MGERSDCNKSKKCPTPLIAECDVCRNFKALSINNNIPSFLLGELNGSCYKFPPSFFSADIVQVGDGDPDVNTSTSKPVYLNNLTGVYYIYNGTSWISTTGVRIIISSTNFPPLASGNPPETFNIFVKLANNDIYFIDNKGVSIPIFTCASLKTMLESDCIADLGEDEIVEKVYVLTTDGAIRKSNMCSLVPKILTFTQFAEEELNGSYQLAVYDNGPNKWEDVSPSDMILVIRNGNTAILGTPAIDSNGNSLYEYQSLGLDLYQPIDSSVNGGKGENFQIIVYKIPIC